MENDTNGQNTAIPFPGVLSESVITTQETRTGTPKSACCVLSRSRIAETYTGKEAAAETQEHFAAISALFPAC